MLPTFGEDPGSIKSYNMIKILCFGRSCKAYLRSYKENSPDVKLCCDKCNHQLHKHGRYYRWVASKRELLHIPIYRWLCPVCGTTVSLLPDFLIPWARFTTWVRESATSRKRQGQPLRQIANEVTSSHIGLSTSTVKRWWKLALKKTASASLWVAEQLVAAGCEEDLLRLLPQPVRATPIATLYWLDLLMQRFAPGRSTLRGYWSFLNKRLRSSPLL
jgi:hypothetical protein